MLTPEGYPKGRAGTEVPLELSRRRGTVADVVRTGWSGKPCADGGKGRRGEKRYRTPFRGQHVEFLDARFRFLRVSGCVAFRFSLSKGLPRVGQVFASETRDGLSSAA